MFSKSQQKLLLVLGVFVLPVVIAKLALEQQWFNYGVTNFGTLAEQELTLTDLDLSSEEFKDQWLMLYRVPAHCGEKCNATLLAVNNTYTLLGKERPRVTPVVLIEKPLAEDVVENLKHPKWQQHQLPDKAKSYLQMASLVIVDSLGNLVMSHDIPADQNELALFSKNVLADMKKLLKYSRIG